MHVNAAGCRFFLYADWDDATSNYSIDKKDALIKMLSLVADTWIASEAHLEYISENNSMPDKYLLLEFISEQNVMNRCT